MTELNPQAIGTNLVEQQHALERRLQVEVETRDRETTALYRQLAHLRWQVEELGRALAAGKSEPADGSSVSPDHGYEEWGRGATLGLLRIMGSTGQMLRHRLVDVLLQQRGIIEAVSVSRESGGHPVHL